MKKPIFQWNGEYWGFIYNNKLFNDSSDYFGWIDGNNQVWKHDGSYLGELVEDNYILRRSNKVEPIPKIPPIPPIPPIPKINKIPKIPKIGWIDPLEDLEE